MTDELSAEAPPPEKKKPGRKPKEPPPKEWIGKPLSVEGRYIAADDYETKRVAQSFCDKLTMREFKTMLEYTDRLKTYNAAKRELLRSANRLRRMLILEPMTSVVVAQGPSYGERHLDFRRDERIAHLPPAADDSLKPAQAVPLLIVYIEPYEDPLDDRDMLS